MNGAGSWPDLPTKFDSVEADKELMKNIPDVVYSLIAASKEDRPSVNLEQIMKIRNFGSRVKLLRTIGYVLRFIAILKNGNRADQIKLTASEYSMGDHMWTQTIQAFSFPLELLRFNSGKSPVNLKQLML